MAFPEIPESSPVESGRFVRLSHYLITGFFVHPNFGCLGFLNHQQYVIVIRGGGFEGYRN